MKLSKCDHISVFEKLVEFKRRSLKLKKTKQKQKEIPTRRGRGWEKIIRGTYCKIQGCLIILQIF